MEITRTGDVAELCLDWPERRNAFGVLQARELREALLAVATCAVVIVRAEGRAFCAGGDLREIAALAALGPDAVASAIYSDFQALFRVIDAHEAVLLAAVDGPAVGFGCDLALACDVTFLGARGWLAQGWARLGLIPATGGALYAKRRAGVSGLWRFMAKERLSPAEADELKLAVAVDDARSAARDMARALMELPAEQLRATKALSRLGNVEEYLPAALAYQREFITGDCFKARAARLLSER